MRIRGHTLLCLQGFRGKGYSQDFVDNLSQIHEILAAHPEICVEVVDTPDAVCGACPHRQVSGCSLNGEQSEEEMHKQDHHVLGLLGLEPGVRVHWSLILDRIRASVTGDDLPSICGQCRWLPLGYCREGIDGLREQEISK
jgi:uncharacterized protein